MSSLLTGMLRHPWRTLLVGLLVWAAVSTLRHGPQSVARPWQQIVATISGPPRTRPNASSSRPSPRAATNGSEDGADRPGFVPDPALQKVIQARKERQQRIAAQKQKVRSLVHQQWQAEEAAAQAAAGSAAGPGPDPTGVCGELNPDGTICRTRVPGGGPCDRHL